ncbi:hypothetical protein MYAM1_003730 [Malassezia yamatoensis]|uniref:Uncharacterized protein n=1 Tax=Malassezia yamatoensis TaxID=253288 RepID=A0AAJ5YWN3_9BASI|nr:hypothetical protein MYAM1_003730 [Malassezia yamatoensis]
MRKLGYLLFSVLAMVHTQAKISGSNVPYIYPEHAQVQAKLHPAKITHANPNSIYDQVSLETVARPGNAHSPGWTSPKEGEGSMLDITGNGFREPINVIISGHSDLSVLSEHGLLNYVRSIGFSFECLHLHLGGLQFANLGDGHGWQPQLFEYRSLIYPGSLGVWLGSCWESLAGGNHFRVWKQNGSLADTGAWFLAVSKEEDAISLYRLPNEADHSVVLHGMQQLTGNLI